MPSFARLWAGHPNVTGEPALLDKRVYENQCAINTSAAMMRAGIDFSQYKGTLSWQPNKPKYPIRAQELANWMASGAARLGSRMEKLSGKEVFGDVEGVKGIPGRTGIVFFQNYWGPGSQGDHIDLWNGTRLTHWSSWLQIHARLGPGGRIGINSELRAATAVWFWSIA